MTICDVIAMWPKQHGVLRSLSPVSAQARKKAEEAAVEKSCLETQPMDHDRKNVLDDG